MCALPPGSSHWKQNWTSLFPSLRLSTPQRPYRQPNTDSTEQTRLGEPFELYHKSRVPLINHQGITRVLCWPGGPKASTSMQPRSFDSQTCTLTLAQGRHAFWRPLFVLHCRSCRSPELTLNPKGQSVKHLGACSPPSTPSQGLQARSFEETTSSATQAHLHSCQRMLVEV